MLFVPECPPSRAERKRGWPDRMIRYLMLFCIQIFRVETDGSIIAFDVRVRSGVGDETQ